MANFFNHPRKRNYEHYSLKLSHLKFYAVYDVGQVFQLRWKSSFCLLIKRTQKGFFVYVDSERGYQIPIEYTRLIYGNRPWYVCPACQCRCGALYYQQVRACRKCLKPVYEPQNGSKKDHMVGRIRMACAKLWHDVFSSEIDDLLESCCWWPKSKNIHRKRFEVERKKVLQLERRYMQMAPRQYQALFNYP